MKPKNVEDMYPLSPMQQGMLFHARYAPESANYFVQWAAVLRGELHVPLFQDAWQSVIDRHPSLRALFIWDGLDQPLQVVRQQARAPWAELDWRDRSETAQQDELAALLLADQSRGFDLARAPLMRFHLIQLADDTHQLIWSFHHMLIDGWSIGLVLKQVFAHYHALCQGAAFEPAPARPYRDYIAWIDRQDLAQAEQFWRSTLRGFSAPTPFVVDQPSQGSAEILEHGERYDVMPAAAMARIQAFARAHQLTLSTMIHGAWALLLSRYSASEDVLFGSVVSGRPADLVGTESMVGLFLNTLPVRVRAPGDAAVLPWLQALQAQQAEARQYEYSPLAQVQGWSAIERGRPLFESLLSFENYPIEGLALGTTDLQIQDGRAIERTNYPLNLSIIPGAELSLKLIYDRRRFDAATIERLVGHLQTLLLSLAADPDQHLADVEMLTDSERHQLLFDWNATAADYPQGCLHNLFEAQVARTPDAIAAAFVSSAPNGGSAVETLSYRELNQRANQLAHHLCGLGVGPEALVGLCVERSLDMLIGVLGILKAGGAYVPLDPAYPAERLAFMLEDAQVVALVAQEHLLDKLPWASAGIPPQALVCLDRDRASIAAAPVEPIASGATIANLAYVIYTSGSTGRPKGVLVEHRGIGNLSAAQMRAFDICPDSRILQFSSLSFDASLFEIVMAVLSGATLYMGSPDALLAGPALLRLLREQAITTATLSPSVLAALPVEDLPALRTIIVAGEACAPELAARWAAGRQFLNAYGPTETTVWATIYERTDARLPIGRPISNTATYLLDERLRPVPVGVPGELYIGGIGLARGYHNRPELTTERFVPNPFADHRPPTTDHRRSRNSKLKTQNSKLYRTGDLARYLPDGNIEFLGRIDHQVKLRGFRIELGEIEAALLRHAMVQEAVVVVRAADEADDHSDAAQAAPSEKRLVAYVVPRIAPVDRADAGQVELWPSLKEHLRKSLPEYMVPAAIVALDAMPLTPNGKLDRAALPAPSAARPELAEAFAAPQTAIERSVATLWHEVLQTEQIGIHDNFFDLGGHSLLLAQIHSKIERMFDCELSLVDMFKYPTVHLLAQRISQPPTEQQPETPGGAREAQWKAGRSRMQQRRASQQRDI